MRYVLILALLAITSGIHAQQTEVTPPENVEILKANPDKIVPQKKLSPEQITRIKELKNQIKTIRSQTEEKLRNLQSYDELTQKKVEEIKFNSELQILKLRREIAVIYGDQKRVKEFDEAIDHLEHPEKYRKPPVKSTRENPSEFPVEEERVR